jgi:hypothetical protein
MGEVVWISHGVRIGGLRSGGDSPNGRFVIGDPEALDATGETGMDDTQLSQLSLLELQDLQAKLHVAIRAAIRQQQEAKAAGRKPSSPVVEAAPTIDLARERDAWLARRRSSA